MAAPISKKHAFDTNIMDEEFLTWTPPTEAEMKIIQARRERSDKISKIMGDYLLKGYKMLGICCNKCDTILLEDKGGKKYCIACQELDTDTDKDDPVMNANAARSQAAESSVVSEDHPELPPMRPITINHQQSVRPRETEQQINQLGRVDVKPPVQVYTSATPSSDPMLECTCTEAVETLCQKIKWASDELKQTCDIDRCIHLCDLLKASAEAVCSLKKMQYN